MPAMGQQSGLGKRESAITALVPWATFVLTGLFFVLTLNSNYLYILLPASHELLMTA
jgi:hypothetical protein